MENKKKDTCNVVECDQPKYAGQSMCWPHRKEYKKERYDSNNGTFIEFVEAQGGRDWLLDKIVFFRGNINDLMQHLLFKYDFKVNMYGTFNKVLRTYRITVKEIEEAIAADRALTRELLTFGNEPVSPVEFMRIPCNNKEWRGLVAAAKRNEAGWLKIAPQGVELAGR